LPRRAGEELQLAKRSHGSLILAVLVVNFFAGAWFGYQSEQRGVGGMTPAASGMAQPAAAPEPELRERSRLILPGESLMQVLLGLDVPARIILEWRDAAKGLYDISQVRPGQEITVRYAPDGSVAEFALQVSRSKVLLITRNGEGYEAELREQVLPKKEIPRSKAAFARKFYQGTIDSNLYQAGIDAGMDPDLIMNLATIFSIQFHFASSMKKGDRFEALTEVMPSGDEKLLAAKLVVGGKAYNAYYYKDGSRPGYFDEKARAWEGFQLIRPVRYTRISSHYTRRRYNPVLGYVTPHLAVDYAARQGTPVKAAAAGVITFAGWRGGYGNYIELRHNSKYSTAYGHMSRLARGVRSGSRVRQGQVIGYVGATGRATGPHLDYRVFKNGGSVNPLRFKGERVKRVNALAQFNKTRLAMEIEIECFKQAVDIPNEKVILAANAGRGQ